MTNLTLRTAEAVLAGHPDKLADQIADAVVDVALSRDPRAIAQVEVAVHDHHCHVNGRVATVEVQDRDFLEATIRAVYERVGFGATFEGSADPDDYACPRPADVQLQWALQLETADPAEQANREHSDDQAIHTGYAVGVPEQRWLPLEQHLVLVLRDALGELAATDRALGVGPDGKVLVALREEASGRAVLDGVVTSLLHLPSSSMLAVDRAARRAIVRALEAEAVRLDGRLELPADLRSGSAIRVNPAGVFSVGGPVNDNGQTGRKLVADFYGPRVAIGGGALSGKDPWRLDRAGALRARQIAVAMVETGFVRKAHVTFAWAPRDRRPSWVQLVADGRVLDARTTAWWTARIDPSIGATVEELGLPAVNWETCARAGHFGGTQPWEGGVAPALPASIEA